MWSSLFVLCLAQVSIAQNNMSPRKRSGMSPGKEPDKARVLTTTDGASNSAEGERRFPLISYKRILTRLVIVFGTMIAARYMFGVKTLVIASVSETVDHRFIEVTCSDDYAKDRMLFEECTPKKCGRTVMDGVVTQSEAKNLLTFAKAGLAMGGSNGGASILDVHSGALSKGDKFINIYSLLDKDHQIFTEADFKLYKKIRTRIQSTIATQFEIPERSLYLTKPTFFSKMTARPAKTIHDEYWHNHVDKETYGSFDYTCLLYLSDMDTDFKGGRFIFTDKDTNRTVEPKLGRLSFFTSASENVHCVERVSEGVRYALTVSFTCDPDKAIKDPTLKRR